MPPSMRCLYNCEKDATGDIDRSAMLRDLQEKAAKTPDIEDQVKFVPGLLRGKKVGSLLQKREIPENFYIGFIACSMFLKKRTQSM